MVSIARLQEYLRQSARAQFETIAAPPFSVIVGPERSYAVPDEPLVDDLAPTIAGLEAVFATRQSQPVVEYVEEAMPYLGPALIARNWARESQSALMGCTRASFRPAPSMPGLTFSMLSIDTPLTDIREGLDVNERGFDPASTVSATDEDAERFRQTLVDSKAFIARFNDVAVSGGMWLPPLAGMTALVGIATLAPHRRRGIATALTAHMVEQAFARGVDAVVLGAANDDAGRVYQRVGFQRCATHVIYSRSLAQQEP